jgi:hypothetical protein
VGVDHDNDSDDRRAVVRRELGDPAPVVVTEDDLEQWLREHGYYSHPRANRPPLAEVLPSDACEALPEHLQAELRHVGPAGPKQNR